jgi:hypothetical protein
MGVAGSEMPLASSDRLQSDGERARARMTTAGTRALFGAQFVNPRVDGETFEVGQVPPALAPLYAPKFFLRFRRRSDILRLNHLAVPLLGEDQQQLGQIPRL